MKLEQIKIVMVETTHPGNIGAAARAMHNMALSQLVLVNPKCQLDEVAYARASGADSILQHCQRTDDLLDAVANCSLVVGTSARSRSLAWPQLTPRTLAEKCFEFNDSQSVAIVFGREHSGLTNEELQHCQFNVSIPCNPEFSSLNVASAIQVISYELFQQQMTTSGSHELKTGQEALANHAQMEGWFEHLEQVMISTGFLDPQSPRHLMKRLRRLFHRAEPSENEINILRGILTSVEKFRNRD